MQVFETIAGTAAARAAAAPAPAASSRTPRLTRGCGGETKSESLCAEPARANSHAYSHAYKHAYRHVYRHACRQADSRHTHTHTHQHTHKTHAPPQLSGLLQRQSRRFPEETPVQSQNARPHNELLEWQHVFWQPAPATAAARCACLSELANARSLGTGNWPCDHSWRVFVCEKREESARKFLFKT